VGVELAGREAAAVKARKPLRWFLAWRTEFDHNLWTFPSEIQARDRMRDFAGPKSWAAVIDPYKFVFVAEVGLRFGAVQSSVQRKGAARESKKLAARAVGNG
jgi:hypothetical protein